MYKNKFSFRTNGIRSPPLIFLKNMLQCLIHTCVYCYMKQQTLSVKFLGQVLRGLCIYQYPSFHPFYKWKLWNRRFKNLKLVRKRPVFKGGHNAYEVLAIKHNSVSLSDMLLLLLFKITLHSRCCFTTNHNLISQSPIARYVNYPTLFYH